MSDDQLLEDPTNRVVSVFDERSQAEQARQEFVRLGLRTEQVRVMKGSGAAEKVDASPKWFADTDEEIKRYERELKAGNTILSVPVSDSNFREKVHAVLKQHNARLITHFGEWVTEMMK